MAEKKEVTLKDGNSVEWITVPGSLHVAIVSPERQLFSDSVDGVLVPGEKGSFEVRKNHAPIISTLSEGTIVCRGKKVFTLPVKGGFIEVAHNAVSICVEV